MSLDIVRVLLSPLEALAATDIADHALEALRDSAIREVVILARRGPRHAAFSVGEFLALGLLPNVDVVIEADDLQPHPDDDIETIIKLEVARDYATRQPTPGNKRIVFRFFASPEEIVGDARVHGVRVSLPKGGSEVIETGLVLRSTGYHGSAITDVPFDVAAGTVPNDRGRVVDETGRPVTGVYVTGWIKRGPRGVIGTNRTCAEETAARLWEDFDAGLLAPEVGDRNEIDESLAARAVTPVGRKDWAAIDEAERQRGAETSRPRVKFVEVADMLAVVRD